MMHRNKDCQCLPFFAPYMHDEAAAFAHAKGMLWTEDPVLPKCGVVDNADELKGVRS